MFYAQIFLPCFVGLTNGLLGIGTSQNVDVEGRLTCDGQPTSNVLVKLYDSNKITFDNLLGQANTDGEGEFKISGKINDITSMNPKIDIFHNCHNGALRCTRKLVINLPSSAINRGDTYNIGNIELANAFQGESHDCIH